jgi:hypothetical protein
MNIVARVCTCSTTNIRVPATIKYMYEYDEYPYF